MVAVLVMREPPVPASTVASISSSAVVVIVTVPTVQIPVPEA